MSVAHSSQVVQADGADPEMQRAYEQARASFRWFWREVAWDRRRIVPALDFAAIKAPFVDDAPGPGHGDAPEVEHMWLSDLDFDGEAVAGVLGNDPNWLTSVRAGDTVRVPVERISDWMYVKDGAAYGAFTVNVLRARMDPAERRGHDEAWGLDFGDPGTVRMDTDDPHPMSETMAGSLRDALARDPSLASVKGANGWTLLHQEASAGSAATARVLLDAGADPGAPADNGMTPLQLATALGWEPVAALLARGASAPPPAASPETSVSASPETAPPASVPSPASPAPASSPSAQPGSAAGSRPPAPKRPWWRFWD